MKQNLNTKVLAIILALCLIILGVVVYLLIPKECKHHLCDKVVSEPTCDAKGFTTYVCKKCEYTFEADFVAPLGHTYESVVTAPTCEGEGYTTHTCSVCASVKKDTIVAPLKHDYESKVTQPTCESEGYTTNTCKTCGYETITDYIEPLGHNLKETVVAPTCESEGYTLFECTSCDYEYKNTYVKPAGHRVISTITAPTCTAQGYTTHKCANCEYSYVSDYVQPTGHSVIATQTVAPTCDTQGYTTYKCSKCALEYAADDVDPLGHSMNETENVAATCTTKGYTKHKCANCDYEYSVDVYPAGHSINTTINSTPTYTSVGSTTYTCENCDYERTTYVSYFEIFTGAEGTGEGALAKGVDISKWSDAVNFEALKAAGIDFVIIRVGAHTNKDPKFEDYYKAAKAAGLDVGAYFFTYAESVGDAIRDAYNVVEWIKGKQFEYPIFFDVENDPNEEYYPSTFDEELITNMSHAFMSTLLSCGYYPGLYTNLNFLTEVFDNDRVLSTYDIWFARYQTVTDELILDYSDDYSMWQYAGDVYEFTGVSGACDLNYAFKDYPAIMQKYGFNGYGS